MMKPVILITTKDYVSFPAEALVNSSNDMLQLGSNIAGRLLAAAGPELAETVSVVMRRRNQRPFRLGEATYTPAFAAGKNGITKYIIHGVTMGNRDAKGIRRLLATPESVFAATQSTIVLADRLK